MPTLRTHMIDANNISALPASRYRIQHYNSLQQTKEKRAGIQPVRYVKVTKQVILETEKKSNKEQQKIIPQKKSKKYKKLIKAAENKWVRGHGTIERIDKDTGDIFHLIHTDAIYRELAQEDNSKPKNTEACTEKNRAYTHRLIQVKIPLKLNQKPPSEVLSQETITIEPELHC